ncbi:hypothetical protein ACFQXA_21490 [Nocardiopsis composta]
MELDPGLDPAEWSPEVREAVAAIRRHLGAGPGARNGGWDRTPDRERDDRAAARAALDLLDREAAAERPRSGRTSGGPCATWSTGAAACSRP